MDMEVFRKVFSAYVRPKLEYAASVWSCNLRGQSDLSEECPEVDNKDCTKIMDMKLWGETSRHGITHTGKEKEDKRHDNIQKSE